MLQEGHPVAVREAQNNTNWLESLTRGGEGLRGESFLRALNRDIASLREEGACCAEEVRLTLDQGYGPLLREYVYFLLAKLAFHKQHPEFNGMFLYCAEVTDELTWNVRSFRI